MRLGDHPLFAKGFRPFFLLAAGYAVVAMLIWAAAFHWQLVPAGLRTAPMLWHAHEMIFGFALAVIAGFLLTAVQNWTGIATCSGNSLAALAFLWLVPRIVLIVGGHSSLPLAAVVDLLFQAALFAALARPILLAKNWRQTGILAILAALFACNLVFYLGLLGFNGFSSRSAVYIAVYLVVGLVLLIGARVIPFFTGKRVDVPYTPKPHARPLKVAAIAFATFVCCDQIVLHQAIRAGAAAVTAVALALVICRWHVAAIWRKPMLWVLFLAYSFFPFGFVLYALAPFLAVNPNLGLHAFAAGGIGLMVIAMMTRVAIGHTGRNVDQPPRAAVISFICVAVAAVCRTAVPLFLPHSYRTAVLVSQIFWVAGFLLFLLACTAMLIRPRPDGAAG